MNKPAPKIGAAARPMRIAYVVEDGEDAHQWLDEVIAECFARHGGRQSLIVPCTDGTISARYSDWLKTIDPDVVMLLTYTNEEVGSDLGELLGDTALEYRQRKRGEIEIHPRVRFEKPSLTALSWIPFLKTVSGIRRQPVEFILDCYPTWEDDGLIKDNFGTLYASADRFPLHEQIGMRPLILTPENPPANRWHMKVANAEELQDSYGVLENLQQSGVATLAHLSNLNCQPFRPDHAWRDAFCLVVGDSFEDRVASWNAGLLFDDATSQTYKTMRIPTAVVSDVDKTAKVAAFLRGANWIGGNSGPPKIAVRSHSLNETSLAEFVARIGPMARSAVTFAAIASLDDCCPAGDAKVHSAYRAALPSSATDETTASDPSTFVATPAPFHLKYSAGQHPIFSQGGWYVDLNIDKFDDHGRYDNIRQRWMLPKRRQLIRRFVKKDGTRILRYGGLSVPADVHESIIEVTQPNDEALFRSLLVEVGYLTRNDIRFEQDIRPAYKHVEQSDKGRYLAGLLGMFGSLSDLEHTMNMRFWRRQFYAMAAPANDQHAEVITLLKSRLKAKDGTLLINDTEGWDRLGNHVVRNASRLKIPRLRTRYDKLLKQWLVELEEAINLDSHLKHRTAEILAEAPRELKSSLGFLVDRRVFYRGHEWVCRNCSHRNWANLRALADEMPCEVCASSHSLPVDVAMDFRLNEFFATCLREHDTFTVACILATLRRESQVFFSFYPQAAIYREYPEDQGETPSRELDILCVSDGKFLIGEAKARAELIAPSDILDLAETAKNLRVDVAILATLSDERSLMPSKLKQLRELLPESIDVRSIVASWDDEPSAYLAGQMFTFAV
jgi:hypothetical protein